MILINGCQIEID